MGLVLALIFLAVIAAIVAKGAKSERYSPPPPHALRPTRPAPVRRQSIADQLYSANREWLRARWAEAETRRLKGKLKDLPRWYFDPVTERQQERLASDGFSLHAGSLTKGQASDLIDLLQPAEPHHADVLKFFKAPTTSMNKTVASVEAPRLLADPKKAAEWARRPAEPWQKECLRFYGATVPRALTADAADGLIKEREAALATEGSPLIEECEVYLQIVSDFADAEYCRENGIKKPSVALLREVFQELRDEVDDLEWLTQDPSWVTNKIIELRPDLQRAD
jgi:hypothetical protein